MRNEVQRDDNENNHRKNIYRYVIIIAKGHLKSRALAYTFSYKNKNSFFQSASLQVQSKINLIKTEWQYNCRYEHYDRYNIVNIIIDERTGALSLETVAYVVPVPDTLVSSVEWSDTGPIPGL